MASRTDLEGTCPACFRTVALVERMAPKGVATSRRDLRIGRHGWSEAGGRQVGHYNQAWHVGECFGVGYQPFELSPEGTRAFVEQVLFPGALAAQNRQRYLATCPPVVVELAFPGGYDRQAHRYIHYPLCVRLQPSDNSPAPIGEYPNSVRVPTYEKAWTAQLDQATAELGHYMGEGRVLCERIRTWKLERVTKREPRVVVHAENTHRAGRLLCSFRTYSAGRNVTADHGKVTCTRCRKALGL
jgi:hypothetical protein